MDVNAEYLRLKAAIRSDPRTSVALAQLGESQDKYLAGELSFDEYGGECYKFLEAAREIEASHSRWSHTLPLRAAELLKGLYDSLRTQMGPSWEKNRMQALIANDRDRFDELQNQLLGYYKLANAMKYLRRG